jgi:hypothetical protein
MSAGRAVIPMLCVAALALAACGRAARDTPPATAASRPGVVDSDRFPHALHTGDDPRIRGYAGGRGLGCTDCHLATLVTAGKTARPGADQHAPCDSCHREEFYRPPGAFCRNCHVTVDPTRAKASPLVAYPERGLQKMLAARFSHALHLDRDDMDEAVGFHVDCGDCHVRDASSRDPLLPGHAQCARCHQDQAAASSKLAMSDCAGCHPSRKVELTRGRKLITGDLVFAHATHEQDLAGQAIDCRACHDQVVGSRAAEDQEVPAMQRCAVCHEDPGKTPDRVRIENCGVCHQRITAGAAPRNHLVAAASGGVPEDHTLGFRKDHADQARAADARCAYCHTGLSGSPRDSCNECHTRWAPRDHTLDFADESHGREAVLDRDRCATCHSGEFCTACHAQPPRSHRPMAEFRQGGHAEAARFDLRSCFACHTAEDTCAQCHRGSR